MEHLDGEISPILNASHSLIRKTQDFETVTDTNRLAVVAGHEEGFYGAAIEGKIERLQEQAGCHHQSNCEGQAPP